MQQETREQLVHQDRQEISVPVGLLVQRVTLDLPETQDPLGCKDQRDR